MSDSDQSVRSSAPSESGGSYNSEDLSIVAEYDNLMRLVKSHIQDNVLDTFLSFASETKEVFVKLIAAEEECARLRVELDKKISDINELECHLQTARNLLDREKKRSRDFEKNYNNLIVNNARAVNILNSKQTFLPDETRRQLADFLGNHQLEDQYNQLSAIPEVNLTGSLISNFSYSRSEDDLDSSTLQNGKTWKKHRPSTENFGEPIPKKRRSEVAKLIEIGLTEKVRATTTLTVNKDGPITAKSIIETVPVEPITPVNREHADKVSTHLPENLWQSDKFKNNLLSQGRPHYFQNKILVIPEVCGPCNKRIRFGKSALKCRDCRSICHTECKDLVPLPCIPLMSTPQKGGMGTIGDYASTIPPMVPSLIIHCVNEIESRGHNELGLYRIPGSERDVKALKERFFKGKFGPLCLKQADIHVICGVIKMFLRSLQEPLITSSRWNDFIEAVQAKDACDVAPALYQLISELPQPNRDTLAFMVLHLKRIDAMPETKMPIQNLAKIFGPVIVGYSSNDLNPTATIMETKQMCQVTEHLLNLPADYWASILSSCDNMKTPTNKLQQTPSTDSLLCPKPRSLFSPFTGVRSTVKHNHKYFPSPQ